MSAGANGAWMARESGSRSVRPAAVAEAGARGMLSRDLIENLDAARVTARPQSHPNYATEA